MDIKSEAYDSKLGERTRHYLDSPIQGSFPSGLTGSRISVPYLDYCLRLDPETLPDGLIMSVHNDCSRINHLILFRLSWSTQVTYNVGK